MSDFATIGQEKPPRGRWRVYLPFDDPRLHSLKRPFVAHRCYSKVEARAVADAINEAVEVCG